MKRIKAVFSLLLVLLLCVSCSPTDISDTVVLRVCNWEEYIDLGGWDEAVDLDSGDIMGEVSMVEEFEEWYYKTYNIKVKVEYSTSGTNEDLYNRLTLGDKYDLVCPSEYMIMKLMAENKLEPLSEEFFDTEKADNFYIKGVSPYINSLFNENYINGENWAKYAAGYMWGTTGIVYNPNEVEEEDARSWKIVLNEKYNRRITVKDNVRDAYFPVLAILNHEKLVSENFLSAPDYKERLFNIMNDTSPSTIQSAQKVLKQIKNNVYSFETDSGKADLVSGKVVANLQWSGDAVYTLDQAEDDGVYLSYAVPEECTNIWFDGWVKLKDGIAEDGRKNHAAEAFINYVSEPENVIRNMYYIGYTSAISGGEDKRVLEYANWLYGDDEGEENYDVSYFFGDGASIKTNKEQLSRQLFAQYPTEEVINRSAYMKYLDKETTSRINQMWINTRCYSFGK